MSFVSFFTTLFFFALAANASPTKLVAKSTHSTLDVFVPRIITPDSSTVWIIGQKGFVSWDTTNAPKSISNKAFITLSGYDTPLAQGFNLRDGNVTVDVPVVAPGPHFITLFGDSGNYSPVFTIQF
ncbi:hypothetical protein M413DRAFT_21031 [Hebeloma cylindrosporum]|uniref:Uncharacterized protein n=1 Tax=Hebeloma cylindrosporum TaxID=76867 RepID=A0A0C3CX13_HEBCY|nr:hypothetical protein M413DRAFT_21031 [Hebeloma cylindrosporum h7]